MGLSSALASAMSGLRANQAALSIVSSNVANSQTPGYVVQRPNQIEVTTGDFGSTGTLNSARSTQSSSAASSLSKCVAAQPLQRAIHLGRNSVTHSLKAAAMYLQRSIDWM